MQHSVISSFIRAAGLILVCALFAVSAQAQTPIGPESTASASDTAIIFQPSQPLIMTHDQLQKAQPNAWGFEGSFSDYGFGAGLFLSHIFSPDFATEFSVDLGTAQGSREFGMDQTNKINRLFVIPIMASAQYRVFRNSLSENLRPYLTVGAGPVLVMAGPFNQEFFASIAHATVKGTPGGFLGVGANFGSDRKNTFGANLRYYFIPFPSGAQSTTSETLTDFSGFELTASYGFNF